MKLSTSKITRNEEIDYDNKRLVYVNELVPVTTHIYEQHELSTDQVISLFDGGYRFAVIEQLDSLKRDTKECEYQLRVLSEQIHECMDRHGVNYDEGKKLRTSLEQIFYEFQSKIDFDLKKKFDTCQLSNEERVRDEGVKERNEGFLNQLFGSFGDLRGNEGLF